MKPIKFKGHNAIYAQNQPPYHPLPVLKFDERGQVISCWRPSILERLRVLFTGRIWLSVLTFKQPLQPLSVTAEEPFKRKNIGPSDYPRPKNFHPVG